MKVTGNRLQATVMIFLFLLLPTACCLPPVFAADSTPSADIKSKLEELKKEIASKAAKLKQDVNRKLKDKAYVGKVKSKSDQSITLASLTGPKMISINQDTVYESNTKKKTKFSFKTLTEEDYIVGLGDVDETGVLIAKKIILLPTANSEKQKAFLWGKIISISDKLMTLKDRSLKNVAASIATPSKVKLNDFVILTGTKDENGIFEAEFIYPIPQGGILKPKKVATPSAKVASPSAKPKKVN